MIKIFVTAAVVFLLIWANKIRIYLKWQKKAEAEKKPFYRWPESVHQEPEQIKRIRQAQAEHFQIESVGNAGGKICRMKAESDSDFCFVALGICQCEEFKKDGTVEKGIYGDGLAYVRWDDENRLDMNVNIYDVVILKK